MAPTVSNSSRFKSFESCDLGERRFLTVTVLSSLNPLEKQLMLSEMDDPVKKLS
jgi:hypothetical protein